LAQNGTFFWLSVAAFIDSAGGQWRAPSQNCWRLYN